MRIQDFFKNKKVFITGHTGFKGSWLSEILLEFGAKVAGYALETPKGSLFHIIKLEERMESTIADIRNLESLKISLKKFQPEIVIHMAAQPLVIDSYENPVYTYETNVMGTVNVLEVLRSLETVKSFLNVTTDKVYKNNEWEWGYRENEELCGHDPYSNSKSCSELVTYSYQNSFFQVPDSPAISTARSGNVIGGGDFAKNRIVPDCVRAARSKETIMVRNPNSIRPYQHVLECLYGYLLLAMKQYLNKEKYQGNYNFGPESINCITTGELVSCFCNIWGEGCRWEMKSIDGPHEANFLKLDCSKAKAKLNWHPKWNVEKAITQIVEWEKAYSQGEDVRECMCKQIKDFFREI